jgi:hypothetical protein
VGILPANAPMGAFFTATSMIGFIAGTGIIVRNSIILVDFIELRRSQATSDQTKHTLYGHNSSPSELPPPYLPTPRLRRNVIIGHQLVNPD